MTTYRKDKPNFKFAIVNGGAAGNITVTGIGTDDIIVAVCAAAFTINATTPANDSPIDLTSSAGDLTAEFSIAAADTINNTGGTSTANNILLVMWIDVNP